CRVALTKNSMTGQITAVSDGQPDYSSMYFATTNACYAVWPTGFHNPNTLTSFTYNITFPATTDTNSSSMSMHWVVGLAVNGVPIYGNFAAPGDDIYFEAQTFDKCDGHPENAGQYHYHSEPQSITNNDSNFVGVMNDGYPIYGRKDSDGTT